MRPIGTLPTETDAVRFGDYLVSIGLRNHVEPARDGAWLVWIESDDHIEQGQLQLRQFQANPNDPRYADASAAARVLRKQAEQAALRRRKNFTDVRTSWSGLKMRPTPVAATFIVICIIVGMLTLLGMSENKTASTIAQALLFQPANAAIKVMQQDPQALLADHGRGHLSIMFSSIAHGQVWRLITPIFLHFDPLHLLFNLSWIFAIGRLVEARKGALFLLALVLGAAIVSNVGEALWSVYFGDRARFGYASFGGFSGVNYALFGYAWMKGRLQPYEMIGVGQQTVGLMLTWLVLCMLGILGPIANAAHVVGLGVGVLVGAWPTLMRKARRQ